MVRATAHALAVAAAAIDSNRATLKEARVYHPIYSYLTPPPKRTGRSLIIELDKDWVARSSGELKPWRRTGRQARLHGGRKRLTKWVPHLWRLQRRIELMRRDRTA